RPARGRCARRPRQDDHLHERLRRPGQGAGRLLRHPARADRRRARRGGHPLRHRAAQARRRRGRPQRPARHQPGPGHEGLPAGAGRGGTPRRRPRHRRSRARPVQHHRAPVAGDARLRRGRRRRVRRPRGAHRRPAALPLPRGPMTTQTAAPAPTTAPPPLRPLLDQLAAGRDLNAVRDLVEEGARSGEGGSIVAATGLFPFLVADLARRATADQPLVVVTATTRAAEDLRAALSAMVGTAHLVALPAWETLPHARLSPRADTAARRLSTLRRIAHPETEGPAHVVLMPVRSLLQPIAKGLGDLRPVRAAVGDSYPLEDLERDLVDAAYVRVDMVEKRGEFAVRGGILDVFPPTEPHPVRVDLFGDEIDDVRYFSVADQRSLDPAPRGLEAPPCREILLTDEVRERARARAEELPGVRDLLLRIADGIAADGMESLSPVLGDGVEQVADVLPEGARFLGLDPEKARARADELVATTEEFLAAAWSSAAAGGGLPIDVGAASFVPLSEAKGHAREGGRPWFSLAAFGLDTDVDLITASTTHPGYSGKPGDAAKDLERRRTEGWSVVSTMVGPGGARHVAENLRAEGLPAVFAAELADPVAP